VTTTSDCFTTEDGQHNELCLWHGTPRCQNPSTHHVNYGTGCSYVCGVHKNRLLRLKPSAHVRKLKP
jgi:hypothetical protein